MNIPFIKMHGLGNDFVVIDAITQPILLTTDLVRQMADRHLGVGCDQLLLIEPAKPGTNADYNYRVFNADGSEVGQCGNGARCVGRYLWDSKHSDKDVIVLGAKERLLQVRAKENGIVAVDMGNPIFVPEDIPFKAASQSDEYMINISGKKQRAGVVSIGNPHVVFIVNNVDEAPVEDWGMALQHHPDFPEQVNVGFMACVNRHHIRLRVYERGVGETIACGSGACAAVIVGRKLGLLDEQVQVELRGGMLKVKWSGEVHPVWLEGLCETVFRGEWLKS